MLKIVLGLVLLAHGIGHSLGLLQLSKVATINPAWQGDSWILSNLAGATMTHVIAAVVWTAALLGFVLLAGVVVGWLPATWWSPLAIAAAAASLLGLLLFPSAFPTSSTIGALVVDVLVLAAVLLSDWGPSDLQA